MKSVGKIIMLFALIIALEAVSGPIIKLNEYFGIAIGIIIIVILGVILHEILGLVCSAITKLFQKIFQKKRKILI